MERLPVDFVEDKTKVDADEAQIDIDTLVSIVYSTGRPCRGDLCGCDHGDAHHSADLFIDNLYDQDDHINGIDDIARDDDTNGDIHIEDDHLLPKHLFRCANNDRDHQLDDTNDEHYYPNDDGRCHNSLHFKQVPDTNTRQNMHCLLNEHGDADDDACGHQNDPEHDGPIQDNPGDSHALHPPDDPSRGNHLCDHYSSSDTNGWVDTDSLGDSILFCITASVVECRPGRQRHWSLVDAHCNCSSLNIPFIIRGGAPLSLSFCTLQGLFCFSKGLGMV